jgi:Domain of unknown function (DUF4416)
MGEVRRPEAVNLVCPMLAARPGWLDAATERLEAAFGPADLVSETWPWPFSSYYQAEMGAPLLRRILSLRELVAPDAIIEVKLRTNRMEKELAASLASGSPARPVNLDPGYVALSKMVLATTKGYAHRLYLGRGIYAECTLRWRRGSFQPYEWTYRDYATEEYRAFFARVRALYVEKLRGAQTVTDERE